MTRSKLFDDGLRRLSPDSVGSRLAEWSLQSLFLLEESYAVKRRSSSPIIGSRKFEICYHGLQDPCLCYPLQPRGPRHAWFSMLWNSETFPEPHATQYLTFFSSPALIRSN